MSFETIPISEIRLTFSELHRLRKSRTHEIALDNPCRLIRLKLVNESLMQNRPGGMPNGTGLYTISERGIDFLIYHKSHILTKWVPYWITTAIALAGLINSILARLGM